MSKPLEYRVKQVPGGFEARTFEEQWLFGVLLTDEIQTATALEQVQAHAEEAAQQAGVEQRWEGHLYGLSFLESEVTAYRIGASSGDGSDWMDSEGLGEQAQLSICGLVDFRILLDAWQELLLAA